MAPHGNTAQVAWVGIYQTLLWYESLPDGIALPHIVDANRFRSSGQNIWRDRGRAFEAYLAEALGCRPEEVAARVDQLIRQREFVGLQRQNPLGIAFIGIVRDLLVRFGDPSLHFRTEFPSTELFPSVPLIGRSTAPKIDIAVFRGDVLTAIISCKWSLRHDRMGDLTTECRAYRSAGLWGRRFRFYVVTNEFDAARLVKVTQDDCFDSVFHVRKDAVTRVCHLDGRLGRLGDLVDLIEGARSW